MLSLALSDLCRHVSSLAMHSGVYFQLPSLDHSSTYLLMTSHSTTNQAQFCHIKLFNFFKWWVILKCHWIRIRLPRKISRSAHFSQASSVPLFCCASYHQRYAIMKNATVRLVLECITRLVVGLYFILFFVLNHTL